MIKARLSSPCCRLLPGATRFSVRTRRKLATFKAEPDKRESMSADDIAIRSALIAGLLASVSTVSYVAFREPIEDYLQDNLNEVLGLGDVAGAGLWSLALYFASPLQLLLLFLGRIDTERPSDWITRRLGISAGLDVDALGYTAPQWIQMVVISICLGQGLLITVILTQSLGDSTWAVSSGIGACFAASLYEVGRPRRIEGDEAVKLESQWQDFESWASIRLQKRGNCHESEIFSAFRRENSRYRSSESIADEILRDMIRNWARRGANELLDRTSRGFIKGVSLLPRSDPFTGELTGVEVGARNPALVTRSEESESKA